MKRSTKNLSEGNIYKNFILFALPLVLTGVLNQAYSIIDSIIAGRFLGEGALAATGAAGSISTLISAIFTGYVLGASIRISTLFGAKKYAALKTNVISNFCLVVGVNLLLSATFILFRDPILDFLRIDATIRADAEIYFTVIFAGKCAIVLNNFGTQTVSAMGKSDFPFRMSLLSSAINITGNILSVTLFDLGVLGIALSTVTAAVAVDICYLFKIRRMFKELKSEGRIGFDPQAIKASLPYALPTVFQQSILHLDAIFLSPIINSFGASIIAANEITNKIKMTTNTVYVNSAKTVTVYTSHCIGAEKYKRIRHGFLVGLIQNILLVLPIYLLLFFFMAPIARLFFSEDYVGEAITVIETYRRFFFPLTAFNLLASLTQAFFRGMKLMSLSIAQSVISVTTLIVSSVILSSHFGIYGIFMGRVLQGIIPSLFGLFVYLSGIWKRLLRCRIPDAEF